MAKQLKITIKALEEFEQITGEWIKQSESDRAFAIMGGSLVENCLESWLKSRMVDLDLSDGRTVFTELFNGKGSLTFSQKTLIAYAMRMVDDDDFNDLEVIKNVRNYFAHGIVSKQKKSDVFVPLSFNADEIGGQIARLTPNAVRDVLIGQQLSKTIAELKYPANRKLFQRAAFSLSLALLLALRFGKKSLKEVYSGMTSF